MTRFGKYLIVLFASIYLGCNRPGPSCSECQLYVPPDIPPGIRVDTLVSVKSSNSADGELKFDIEAEIKKILNIGVDGKVHPNSINETTTRKVVAELAPDLLGKREYLHYHKEIYCAYYKIICADGTLSQSEKRELYTDQLERIREELIKVNSNLRRETKEEKGRPSHSDSENTSLRPLLPEKVENVEPPLPEESITLQEEFIVGGTVTDAQDRAVPGVIVNTSAGDIDTTDENGRFCILSFNKKGYALKFEVHYRLENGPANYGGLATKNQDNFRILLKKSDQ